MKRNKTIISLFALTLIMSVFLFTFPAYAEGGEAVQPLPQSETDMPENGSSRSADGFRLGDDTRPFTPDGTGTVVDNVTEADGKEFFTIETPDGNVFYLVIDRQRNSENVYFLNAVTEQDLMSLAVDGDGQPVSGIPNNTSPADEKPSDSTENPAPDDSKKTDKSNSSEPSAVKSGMDASTLIFIGAAVAAIGIAGYYFKIIRPKKQATADDDDDYYDGEDDIPDSDNGDDYGDSYAEGGDDE